MYVTLVFNTGEGDVHIVVHSGMKGGWEDAPHEQRCW